MMRLVTVFVLTFSLALLTAGCVDRGQLKADMIQAIERQAEMMNYRFSGSARMAVDPPEGGFSANPLTASLMSMLMKGDLEWEGVASVDPLQLEALLKLTPQGSGKTYEIPLLIKDNKMYIHIPTVNKDEQFFEIDFQALAEMSDNTDPSPERLSGASELFAGITGEIVDRIEPKRFDEPSESDEDGMRVITAGLNQKQAKEAVSLWFDAMPAVIDRLASAGYLTPEQSDKWKQNFATDKRAQWEKQSDDLTLGKPLTVSTRIDEQGFVRETNLTADLSLETDNGGVKNIKADITNRYDDINADPPFTGTIPENVTPFTEILKMLSGRQ